MWGFIVAVVVNVGRYLRYFWILLLVVFLLGCAGSPVKLPPVTEGWRKSSAVKNFLIVQSKDTLYSIAWAFDLDYRYLARINHLTSPYVLHRGQRLLIASSPISSSSKLGHSFRSRQLLTPLHQAAPSASLSRAWFWPASGKVIEKFDHGSYVNKGIDIAGTYAEPILASNQGTVVYSGTGIRSYGKLIIIKHDDDYLSAYGYNQEMLVCEGQRVKAGQKIATMGQNSAGRAMLHFEVRQFGKPVNPLTYLPYRRP